MKTASSSSLFAFPLAAALMGLSMGCGSKETVTDDTATAADTATTAPKSSTSAAKSEPAPSASAVASTPPPASAAPSGSASAAGDNICRKKGFTEGAGTFADMCKYDGDILIATYTNKIDEEGAVFTVTNPWPEDINWGTVATYYYDKDGKQLSVTIDKKTYKNSYSSGAAIRVAGGKSEDVHFGFKKKELPKEVDTVELEIISFGWQTPDPGAYFSKKMVYSEDRPMKGGKKTGSTGVLECDQFLASLEACAKKIPQMASVAEQLRTQLKSMGMMGADAMKMVCTESMKATKSACP